MAKIHLFSWLLGVAGATGVLTGLVLLAAAKSKHNDESKPSTWLQTDLNTPYFIEKGIYRRHRTVGAALTVAAAFWLWLMSPMTASRKFLDLTWQYLGQLISSGVAPILSVALLALLVLVAGLLLMIRPSLLKPLEAIANRRIKPFWRLTRFRPTASRVGSLALKQPRVAGILLLIGGITCLYGAARLAGI